MFEIRGLSAWYGEAQALTEVGLDIGQGEVVTLVGRNGAGKSTLLRSAMGLHTQVTGTIRLDGHDLVGLPPQQRARRGVGWVPDDRGIYATLTVEEHLHLPPQVHPDAWPIDRVYTTFPVLADRRRADRKSGV